MVYIHYGSYKFDPRRFAPIKNVEEDEDGVYHGIPSKPDPRGGLWASPVDAELGWYDWVKGEDWTERLGSGFFRFLITPAARVYHIREESDVLKMPRRHDEEYRIRCIVVAPDFEQMVADGWDAIEYHLSENRRGFDDWMDEVKSGISHLLPGWDCDSILILNPKIISPLTHFKTV